MTDQVQISPHRTETTHPLSKQPLVTPEMVEAVEAQVLVLASSGSAALAAHEAATGTAVHGLGTASTHAHTDYDAAGAAAAAQAASLPLHGTADDSTKVGGTTPSAFGKTLIDDADAAAARATLGLVPTAYAATSVVNGGTLDITTAAGGAYIALVSSTDKGIAGGLIVQNRAGAISYAAVGVAALGCTLTIVGTSIRFTNTVGSTATVNFAAMRIA